MLTFFSWKISVIFSFSFSSLRTLNTARGSIELDPVAIPAAYGTYYVIESSKWQGQLVLKRLKGQSRECMQRRWAAAADEETSASILFCPIGVRIDEDHGRLVVDGGYFSWWTCGRVSHVLRTVGIDHNGVFPFRSRAAYQRIDIDGRRLVTKGRDGETGGGGTGSRKRDRLHVSHSFLHFFPGRPAAVLSLKAQPQWCLTTAANQMIRKGRKERGKADLYRRAGAGHTGVLRTQEARQAHGSRDRKKGPSGRTSVGWLCFDFLRKVLARPPSSKVPCHNDTPHLSPRMNYAHDNHLHRQHVLRTLNTDTNK
ncbi:hypothetical protein CCUS01_04039 [Colletotrichum cuscutae]|uniref:Uncharacterized protein n=1 Tax=Colletotrichum cuscutae TaxID=1209917 RepID=A0AAI9VI66_9PEZI|nr:hypothetical protein CCUS01_04039 [Colletotrichum cuscutae]